MIIIATESFSNETQSARDASTDMGSTSCIAQLLSHRPYLIYLLLLLEHPEGLAVERLSRDIRQFTIVLHRMLVLYVHISS